MRDGARPRTVRAAAIAAAGALALAGCTSGGTADNAASDGTSAGGGTLTVWHYYSLDNQLKMLDQYAGIFEENNPGYTVENVYVPHDQLNTKLLAAVGTGSGPDVVVFDGYGASGLASSGALAPLTDQWNEFDDASLVAEGAVTTLDGDVYAFQGYTNCLALYYNKDILDEIGVDAPTTIDELESAMQAAVDAGYQGITLSGQPSNEGAFQSYPWLTAEGFSYEDPTTGPLEAGFTRVRSWVENGYLSAEAATWDQNVPFSIFTAGGVAFAENGNWQITNAQNEADFEFGIVPLPGEGGIYLGGEAEAVFSESDDVDLAFEYLSQTFLSKEGQLIALNSVGSIPTRSDAASDDSISSDPYLSVYAQVIRDFGAPYPDAVIPADNVNEVFLNVSTAWSAAISGQQSPADAESTFLTQLESLLP